MSEKKKLGTVASGWVKKEGGNRREWLGEKRKWEQWMPPGVLEGVRGAVPPPSFGALFDGPL